MLGYCGINCHECKAYKGTVTTDLTLLKKAGQSFCHGKYQPEDWVCLGCTPENQKFIAKYCRECVIRKCAVENQVENCAACHQYENCDKILDFIHDNSNEVPEKNELLIRMNLLRKRFLDSQ